MPKTPLELCKTLRQTPVSQLALQLAGRTDLDVPFVLRQVEGWQRLRTKVPTWAGHDELLYPPRLSLEQCSGETAARFKAEVVGLLIRDLRPADGQGLRMADLTGGLGVDFSFMAPLFAEATYVERQEELCRLARHNFPLLGLTNTHVVCADCTDYLAQMPAADLLFLDPARRNSMGRKTVCIEDCEPDVCALLPQLLAKSQYTVLKLSPMLDIAAAMRSLGCVRQVFVVSTGGECKDLLLVLAQSEAQPVRITACEGPTHFTFTPDEEAQAQPRYADRCAAYLYEPGPALLKAGAFKLTATRFQLDKLHPHSHLYTSAQRVDDFPGRRFEVVQTFGFGKQDLKQLRHTAPRANLTVRNFPASTETLRAKLKLREGGDNYIFATTLNDQSHVLLLCRKC